jgi:hypothetical protein
MFINQAKSTTNPMPLTTGPIMAMIQEMMDQNQEKLSIKIHTITKKEKGHKDSRIY